MRLAARPASKAPVEVHARDYKLHALLNVDGGLSLLRAQPAQQREGGDGAEGETGVHLAPLVARETAVVVLKVGHEADGFVHVDLVQPVCN